MNASSPTVAPLAITCPTWCVGEHDDEDITVELRDGGIVVSCDHSTAPWGAFTGLTDASDLTGKTNAAWISVDPVVISRDDRIEDPAALRALAADALAAAEWLEANR